MAVTYTITLDDDAGAVLKTFIEKSRPRWSDASAFISEIVHNSVDPIISNNPPPDIAAALVELDAKRASLVSALTAKIQVTEK